MSRTRSGMGAGFRTRSCSKSVSEAAIPPIFKIVALVVFAQTIFTRAVDPVIPMIAADLQMDVKTVALD